MNPEDSTDQKQSTEVPPSTPIPEKGGGTKRARTVLRRVWVAAGSAAGILLLLLAGLLFMRQATDRERVQRDIDRAAAAFGAGREANAREYAPDQWVKATEEMDEAMAELHRQETRFVLFRSYARVHEVLVRALDAAEAARGATEQAKIEAERQVPAQSFASAARSAGAEPSQPFGVEGPVTDLVSAVYENAMSLLERIEACPRAVRQKQIKRDLETVRTNLEAYRAQIAGLRNRQSRGDAAEARRQAEELNHTLPSLTIDLDGILTQFKCK